MARYVTRPCPEDEWWRPPPKSPDSGQGEDMEQGTGSSEESPTSETEPAKQSLPVAPAHDDDMLR